MCNSSQFVKECRILGKIPLGAYLTVIAQFICRETLATHLLWLMVEFCCDGICEPWKNWEFFSQNGGIRNFVVEGLRNLSKMLLFANFGGIGNFYSKMVGLGFLW